MIIDHPPRDPENVPDPARTAAIMARVRLAPRHGEENETSPSSSSRRWPWLVAAALVVGIGLVSDAWLASEATFSIDSSWLTVSGEGIALVCVMLLIAARVQRSSSCA